MPYPTPDSYRIDDPSQIYSPGLVIFHSLLEHNLDEMVRVAGGPEKLRPHCKTHKIPQIIKLWLDRAVTKHKCATIAEAEMLADNGVTDILIAYQMVGPNLKRLSSLIEKYPTAKVATLVDSPAAVLQLSQAMVKLNERSNGARNHVCDVMLDLNSGMNRTGIALGENAIQLYEMIETSDGVRAAGLHWYDGHHRQPDLQERHAAVKFGWDRLTRFRDQLLMSGLSVPRVVAAGTGSFPILAELGEPDLELSPGTTVFHDDDMATRFPEQNFLPAQAILTRVVSCCQPRQLTLDVGHKSCAADQPFGRRLFFPQLADCEEVMHSEEHLVVETNDADKFQLGDALLAFPRHACPVSAVHQFASVVADGKVIDRWNVVARDRVISI